MKNIHVLPTSQPTNLLLCIKSYIEHKDTPAENSDNKGNFRLGLGKYANKVFYKPHHIYITSNEEIKESDSYLDITDNTIWRNEADESMSKTLFPECKKIILTTDQDLIKDGIQAIDDEFLEWFIKNPSCEGIEIQKGSEDRSGGYNFLGYKIIIPQEESKQELKLNCFDCNKSLQDCTCIEDTINMKQETLEEAAHNYFIRGQLGFEKAADTATAFLRGGLWQAERMYSEKEVRKLFKQYKEEFSIYRNQQILNVEFEDWFEQFKKK